MHVHYVTQHFAPVKIYCPTGVPPPSALVAGPRPPCTTSFLPAPTTGEDGSDGPLQQVACYSNPTGTTRLLLDFQPVRRPPLQHCLRPGDPNRRAPHDVLIWRVDLARLCAHGQERRVRRPGTRLPARGKRGGCGVSSRPQREEGGGAPVAGGA